MSSLLSMALASLTSHTKRSGFIFPYYVLSNMLSNSNYNLPALFLISGAHLNKTQHEQQNVSKGRFFYGPLWTSQAGGQPVLPDMISPIQLIEQFKL